MKETTIQIKNILDDERIEANLIAFSIEHSEFRNFETTTVETLNNYVFIRDTLSEEINSGRFDQISFNSRNQIFQHLHGISTNRTNINYVMQHVDLLLYDVLSLGILHQKIGKTDLLAERKTLSEQKKKYTNLIVSLEDKKESLQFIDESKTEVVRLIDQARVTSSTLQEMLHETQQHNDQIQTIQNSSDSKLEEIKSTQESIEEKRLSITTFANNIEEYKKQINSLETQLTQLLLKKTEVELLIESAHEALKLGSTVGISSAFDAQYTEANNWHKKNWWVIASIMFFGLAVGLTIWIVSDDKHSNDLSVIIGRIVAVGISIAGSVFSSKQYIRQKNIAEDYAYKSVLSKSIVAFSDSIADSHDKGEEQVAVYLNKVLSEIHKDPLRERNSPIRRRNFSDKQIEQITEIVKSIKA